MQPPELKDLSQQIEDLRQKLQDLVQDNRQQFRHQEVYNLSVELDKLIDRFNRLKKKQGNCSSSWPKYKNSCSPEGLDREK